MNLLLFHLGNVARRVHFSVWHCWKNKTLQQVPHSLYSWWNWFVTNAMRLLQVFRKWRKVQIMKTDQDTDQIKELLYKSLKTTDMSRIDNEYTQSTKRERDSLLFQITKALLLVTMLSQQKLVTARGFRVQLKQAYFLIWHRWRTRICSHETVWCCSSSFHSL